jgi:hypothetical protein
VSGGVDQGFTSGVSNLKHPIDTHMEMKTGFRTSIQVSELELEIHVLVVTKQCGQEYLVLCAHKQ